MKTSHRALAAAFALLTLPAGPAAAKGTPGHQPAEAAQPAPAMRQTGFDLVEQSAAPDTPDAARNRPAAPSQRHRTAVKAGPSADLWANMPSPSMTYHAGKHGPVIQLGAFGGDMLPLRKERDAPGDGTIAHVILAWNF